MYEYIFSGNKGLFNFKGSDILSRVATLSQLFASLLKRGCTLKGKNLLPRGANSFPLECIPFFPKGLSVQESKQEVANGVSLVKVA